MKKHIITGKQRFSIQAKIITGGGPTKIRKSKRQSATHSFFVFSILSFALAFLVNENRAVAQGNGNGPGGGILWSISGNSVTATDFLGTNNNFPLVIKTNGAERLRVKETGELLLNHVAGYAADYSMLFTDRSLVDKGWVVSQAYLQANQNIVLSGDITGSGNTAINTTVNWANGFMMYDNRYLTLTGGTLTGALTLNADPVAPLEAATKQYVDNQVGSIPTSHSLSEVLTTGRNADVLGGLNDNTGVQTINLNQRKLFNAFGQVKVDWDQGLLYNLAPSSVISLKWVSRELVGFDGLTTSINWGSRTANDNAGAPSINWNTHQLFNSSGGVKVDWQQGYLYNDLPNSGISLKWITRELVSDDGNTTNLNWGTRILQGGQWEYDYNYANTYTARSLVDKEYVDAAVGSNSLWEAGTGQYSVLYDPTGNSSAQAQFSFIGGGFNNTIAPNASYGSILGGAGNRIENFVVPIGTPPIHNLIASGSGNIIQHNAHHSVILSGNNNVMDDHFSLILGGENNTIEAPVDPTSYNMITNGVNNRIRTNANHSSIIGGQGNTIAPGISGSVILGSFGITATQSNTVYLRQIAFPDGSIQTTAPSPSVNLWSAGAGQYSIMNNLSGSNSAASPNSFVASGNGNSVAANAQYGVILGGSSNQIQNIPSPVGPPPHYNLIGNGVNNIVTHNANNAVILSGQNNVMDDHYSVILGGISNTIEGSPSGDDSYNLITGGTNNRIRTTALNSSIIGGTGNIVEPGVKGSVILGGTGVTATESNTVYVQRVKYPDGSVQTTAAISGGGFLSSGFGQYSIMNNLAGGNNADALSSYIGSGTNNTIEENASYGIILGGIGNRIENFVAPLPPGSNSTHNLITSGENNTIRHEAHNSSIIGGSLNIIDVGAINTTILGGTGIVATESNTVYMPRIVAANLLGSAGQLVSVDSTGGLRIMPKTCVGLDNFWNTDGNNVPLGCNPYIGTKNARELVFKTDANGVGGERMRISATGNVGIGTIIPNKPLTVVGDVSLLSSGNNSLEILGNGARPTHRGISLGDNAYGFMNFYSNSTLSSTTAGFNFIDGSQTANVTKALLRVDVKNGIVAINDFWDYSTKPNEIPFVNTIVNGVPTNYKLAIHGSVIAEEYVAKLRTDWPDYVFSDGYNLKAIEEVEEFVRRESHLPGMPSAEEIAKHGVPLSEMSKMQMEKIEELTLYMIQMNKEIQYLKNENEKLKAIVGK